MFAPEPQQHSEDRAAAGTRRVFKWTENWIQSLDSKIFSSFTSFCTARLLSARKKIRAIYKLILLAHKVVLSSGAWRQSESRRAGRRKAKREHTSMKAKCINSPPILLLCCDRLSNMQAHFLCQRLDEGSQERTLWVSLSRPRLLPPLSFQPFKLWQSETVKNTTII